MKIINPKFVKLNVAWLFLVFVSCVHKEDDDGMAAGFDAGDNLAIRMLDARRESMSGPFEVKIGGELGAVLMMEPMESETLKKLIPSVTVYRLISGRGAPTRPVVTVLAVYTNQGVTHLQSDEAVAFYLGDKAGATAVDSRESALDVVRAFAELRSYRILEAEPKFSDIRPETKIPKRLETDYRFIGEEREREWRVYATFVTQEDAYSVERYIFSIWKSPGSGITLATPVLLRLRDYIY